MNTGPLYRWVPATGRYQNLGTGQFVSEQELRVVFDGVVNRHALEARALALRLQAREISISEFSVILRGLIKDSQLYAAMLAVGGREQMTPQFLGLAGQRIAVQYDFLSKFTTQLRLGLPLDGRVLTRAELYVHSAWATWTVFQIELQRAIGRTQMRNRLRPADHCAQCVALTDLGWQPLGSLVPVGQRICLTRCRCYFEYR